MNHDFGRYLVASLRNSNLTDYLEFAVVFQHASKGAYPLRQRSNTAAALPLKRQRGHKHVLGTRGLQFFERRYAAGDLPASRL